MPVEDRKHVLVVDDSPMVLDLVTTALEMRGYDVTSCNDLEELERAPLHEVDLFLLDVQMPEAFGDHVAAILHLVREVTVPIFLFSHLSDEDLENRVQEAGCAGFISKRNGISAMADTVDDLLMR